VAGVVAIALGADVGVLTRLSTASTAALEQGLVDRLRGPSSVVMDGGAMQGSNAMNGPAMQAGGGMMMKGGAKVGLLPSYTERYDVEFRRPAPAQAIGR
jgi:hypothetical protein